MKPCAFSIIYDNPLPQLRSRHSFFPYLCELDDGTLFAVFQMGQAFESVDCTSFVSKSTDGGVTWSAPKQMFDKSKETVPMSDCCKAINVGGGKLVGVGYEYNRPNPELPVGNPETGGLLDDQMYFTVSLDNGETWQEHQEIISAWGPHVEASAPLTLLQNGDWITPITGFPDWSGKDHGPMCGRVARSCDQGKTWNDDVICMAFEGNATTCYEQRLCQLETGEIVVIGWNENVKTGERLHNHYTISHDNGKTFSKPMSTGIMGQASSVCSIGGSRLLALHAKRRDTDEPGVYGYIVDLADGKWDIQEEVLLWKPSTPVMKDEKMAEIFAFLKFGQPSAILLKDGDIMMTHWFAQDGQYKTCATRIEL